MSQDMMESTHGEFVFKVKKGYLYHPNECWIKEDGGLLTVGITDFLQTTLGYLDSLELPEVGTEIEQGSKAGIIETVPNSVFKVAPKAITSLITPASGVIKELNSALEDTPELINSDPFGAGWLYKLAPVNWEEEKKTLMSAEEYFPVMEEKIEREIKK
ncbi:glycine cleavage system protein H [Pelotomaculum isophthalicicum JI]|uniref:Glycine cleavage system protein H n=1 Tax=Pelotomaculum isophthalicicum JI TaxID=947010 RepID=A0A9X4H731_9FIRM|nr:glycine cleavage system protein H [Pelotomaculum isophthalicicum]MDF9409638.1 glycine cleavage system protein H [Pelotomaculum isophthalicicum JI]